MKRFCWILIMIFSFFAIQAFPKEWSGIIPCVSTRSDVEKILGEDEPPKSEIAIYSYKKSRVHIRYERKVDSGFDKDVVKKIMVYPDKSETLAKYTKKIPNFPKDFLKTEVPNEISHVNGLAYYRNWSEGFEIIIQKNYKGIEMVYGLSYFAANLPSNSSSWC